ncbi:MAG: HAMP domain-containing sensor histidine kinase [Acutalibacteraceae bacterium]|nr:HAMP domain-containing sensor histidine kinase [Acutalibacteraceae bacterium]
MKKGITTRWLMNTFGVILIIVVMLIVVLSLVLQNYYYNGIHQTLNGRVDELTNVFGNYTSSNYSEFDKNSRSYVENFSDKESMELMVLDHTGNITVTSTGFSPDQSGEMPDYDIALKDTDGYGMWTGKQNNENIMSVTRIITDNSGSRLGAVRYCVSLEPANRQIFVLIMFMIVVGMFILFFVMLSGAYFVRSIVNPIQEINEVSKRIAQGDFDARLEKRNDDEIGELCDSINYMAQELGASEKLKNDFISSVSHELRTPLTAIKGWAETMQMGDTPDFRTMEKGMSVIANESERLTGIVEELLDFSRIQSGRMVVNMERIDLLAELDEAIYMLRERALKESKHLIYDEPEYVPPVQGDKNRLRQVFINIIDNALKYTPESGVIGIEVTHDNENIKITISDNGCGIPAEHLPRVKDKFYKANQTQRGSGIGLAVVDEIMNLHGGSLELESTEDIGTTAILTFPIDKGTDEQSKGDK